MAFGLLEAPMYFQYVMEDILYARGEDIPCEPYLDDLTIHGTNWEAVWKHTLRVLELIT
jgi:hypothetical protein